MIVTVVVWVPHTSGFPPSQTWIDNVQLAVGTGPAGGNGYTPVVDTIEEPTQVSPASVVQVWLGPPTSSRVALYVKRTSSVAGPGVLLTTGATLVVHVPDTPGIPL